MKRGGYIKRRTPLRQTKQRLAIRSLRQRTKPNPWRDEERLAWVRKQPCSLIGWPGHRCWGPLDPHHAGRGRAEPDPELRKTCDRTAIPICRGGHREIECLEGPFKGWTKARTRELQDRLIARAQANWASRTSCPETNDHDEEENRQPLHAGSCRANGGQ